VPGGQLTTTNTAECQDFSSGTNDNLTQLVYGIKNGSISEVNPGQFFYYTEVTATQGDTITIDQTPSGPLTPAGVTRFAIRIKDIHVYDSDCNRLLRITSGCNNPPGDCSFTAPGPGTQTYIVRVRYEPSSLRGADVCLPSAHVTASRPSVNYLFESEVNGVVQQNDSLVLNPKPGTEC
jgi:hypothetical protein